MGRISRRAFHGALASALAWSAIPKAWVGRNRPTSVALLLSGVITDGGWSQLAYNGLKELKARTVSRRPTRKTSASRRWTRSRAATPTTVSI